MDKLESMRAFVEVVNHSGFAAAGRHMDQSRSVVNKLVAQLEKDLGVQLLQRTTRRVSPTDMGRAYYERCVDILAEVKAAELSVTQMQAEPKGTLRLNAPMSFGTMHLVAAIAARQQTRASSATARASPMSPSSKRQIDLMSKPRESGHLLRDLSLGSDKASTFRSRAMASSTLSGNRSDKSAMSDSQWRERDEVAPAWKVSRSITRCSKARPASSS